MQLMLALYDYTPATESPNPYPELELSFKKNQVLTIYGDMVCIMYYENEMYIFSPMHHRETMGFITENWEGSLVWYHQISLLILRQCPVLKTATPLH